MRVSAALLLTLLLSEAALADTPSFSVKQFGAQFVEAPPGRDSNLVPMGSFGSQEKVETHAVVAFDNRLIVDMPTFGDESKVTAVAILSNKAQAPIGTANVSNFRKLSADGKKTTYSFSVTRLPDSGIAGVVFSGQLKVLVASAIRKSNASFQPKVGQKLDLGLGNVVVSNVEPSSLTLSGDDRVNAIAGIRIIKPDGSAVAGERGAYSRRGGTEGTVIASQWQFGAPISAGKIEVSVYQDLTSVQVPINLVVTKPY